MAFKVTIIEMTKQMIDEREYKKIADSGNEVDGKTQYGYVIKGPMPVMVEQKIYEQQVADLDLARVILAINATAMEKMHFKGGMS